MTTSEYTFKTLSGLFKYVSLKQIMKQTLISKFCV